MCMSVDLLARGLLDLAQQVLLARRHEQNGLALTAGAARTADPVDVGLGVVRDVEVDHEADALDVEASGGDVGRHEDVHTTVAERLNGALTEVLGNVTVDGRGLEAPSAKLLGDFLRLLLGPHEGDDAVVLLDLEDASHGVQLVGVHDLHVALADVGRRRRLGLDANLDRIVKVLFRELADRLGHGCREQGDLLFLGRLGQDLLDIFGKAHPKHLVGLVENEVLDVGQVQRAALEVVDHAARSADDDLRAPTEPGQLRTVGRTAVDRQDGEVGHFARVGREGLAHLEGEFARRGQDEHLGVAVGPVDVGKLGEMGQGRHSEGSGLPGTGLREADDVAPFEQQRDGLGLDR
jgi:hypothetical protein